MNKETQKTMFARLWQRLALWLYNTAFVQRCFERELQKEASHE